MKLALTCEIPLGSFPFLSAVLHASHTKSTIAGTKNPFSSSFHLLPPFYHPRSSSWETESHRFCLPVCVCLVFLSSLHRIPMKTGRSEWPMNGSITSHKLLSECVLAYRHIKNFHQCVGKCFPKCTTWRAQQSSSPKKVSTKKSAMLGLVRFPRFPKSSIASANVCVLFCVNGVGLL